MGIALSPRWTQETNKRPVNSRDGPDFPGNRLSTGVIAGYTRVPVKPQDSKMKVGKPVARKKRGFLARHSLSIASIAIFTLWTVLYSLSNPKTHWGSFFGNAIADWSGVVVTVLATKYLYERGSAESREPPRDIQGSIWETARDHSLTIFLLVTGMGWVWVY